MIAYPPERNKPTAAANLQAVLRFIGGALLLFTLTAQAQTSVTLAWNPDSSTGVTGYRLYQGVISGVYTNVINVGAPTSATVNGLVPNVHYFFAVTAYTSTGLESPFSNEINYPQGTNATTSPVVVLTSPAAGASYAAPANIGLAATVTANGHTINKVQFFSGSTLLAEDTSSPYTYTWSNVVAGNYSLTAKVVYDSTSSVASAAVSVSVATAPSNPPTSSSLTFASTSGTITAPFTTSNGALYQTVSTDLTNSGRASYSFSVPTAGNYTVSGMTLAPDSGANSFYVNIDAEPTDPYMIWDLPITTNWVSSSVIWRGPGTGLPQVFTLSQGTHQLIVRGREANAELGTITIAPVVSSTPPVVAMTAPNNGTTFSAPAALGLAASVTPNGHTITKVQFFSGSTLLGESTASPYSWTWNNVAAGTYALSATAVYDTGSLVSSTPINVGVTNPVVASISISASSGTITSPFVVSNGIVYQTVSTSTTGAGRAVYPFSVPSTGDYLVSALVKAPDSGSDSFYVNIDADPVDPTMIWDLTDTTTFVKETVSWRGAGGGVPKVFNLAQGSHQLIILGREAGAQLGTITISPATVLPPPWQVMDIGNVGIVTGSTTITNGLYSLSSAGNVSGSSDNFRFLWQPMTGDGDLRAQITSLQNTSTNALMGVMIRETLTPGARYAFLGISPNGAVRSQVRTSTAGPSSSSTSGALVLPSSWTRLVRTGNSILGFSSTDGSSWTLAASNSVSMATTVYFGLAIASGTTNTLAAGTSTNVVAVP